MREGPGLSFFYYAPSSNIVLAEQGGVDVPFAFQGVTQDCQAVTVQGQLGFRVADPRRLASLAPAAAGALRRALAGRAPVREPPSSSGVLVSTGAGSTGWLSSAFEMAAALTRA